MAQTFRVTAYQIPDGAFTGTAYDLTLNHDLESNYFAMVTGAAEDGDNNTNASPDNVYARVTQDRYGTGDLDVSSGNDVIRIERGSSSQGEDWAGVVVIVECLGDGATSGFTLLDVISTELTGTATSNTDTSSTPWSDINQVVPFGGYRGGGLLSTSATSAGHGSAEAKITLSGNDTISFVRVATGSSLSTTTWTTYVVEWGSDWNVQSVSVDGNAGANGASAVSAYDTSAITSVTRANTWVWGAGHTADGGIGDSFSGALVTLGDGVNQNATETTVAVGGEYADTRSTQVYVMENSNIAVDYVFKTDGDSTNIDWSYTVDAATGTESYVGGTSGNGVGIASIQTMNGSDGAWAVLYGATPASGGQLNVAAEEDAFVDTERNHAAEIMSGFFANASSGDVLNSAASIIGEYGTTSGVTTSFSTVNFANTYVDPIVVCTNVLATNTNAPSAIRLDNVGTNSFQLAQVAAGTLEGTPVAETVHYLVIESGTHTLPNLTTIEAGSVSLSTFNSTGSYLSTDMSLVSPSGSFTTPIVLGQIQTYNETMFQAFWANGGDVATPPSNGNIYVGRNICSETTSPTVAEDIGYIIAEQAAHTNDNVEIGFNTQASAVVAGPDDSPPYVLQILRRRCDNRGVSLWNKV